MVFFYNPITNYNSLLVSCLAVVSLYNAITISVPCLAVVCFFTKLITLWCQLGYGVSLQYNYYFSSLFVCGVSLDCNYYFLSLISCHVSLQGNNSLFPSLDVVFLYNIFTLYSPLWLWLFFTVQLLL